MHRDWNISSSGTIPGNGVALEKTDINLGLKVNFILLNYVNPDDEIKLFMDLVQD